MNLVRGKMTDKSSAQKVEITAFEPPKNNLDTASGKSKTLPYALAAGALVVVFTLAFQLFNLLTPSTATELLTGEESSEESTSVDVEVPEDSPFEDALLAEARLEAQEILSQLLPLRTDLEQRGADIWALDELQQIQALGDLGDQLYQARDFDEAILKYQQALDLTTSLETESAEIAASLRSEGYAALESLDSSLAIEKLGLAQRIEPDNPDGQQALQRANNLVQVIDLVSQAQDRLQQDQLQEAKTLAEAALNLDSEYSPAADTLQRVEQAILLESFQQQMSEGYRGLANADYDSAEAAFNSAKNLMPENSAAADALVQLEASREADRGADLMQQARFAENAEQWQQAKDFYDQLLVENPNRVEARVALVKVEARLDLDNRINAVLQDPLSLRDDSRWRNAENLLIQAGAVRDAGPLLEEQTEELAEVIRKARTPVRVEITSDGETEVSVLGLSQLGRIRSHPLELNPGTYVLVGKKAGFQDVREEIVLTGDRAIVNIHLEPTRSLGEL